VVVNKPHSSEVNTNSASRQALGPRQSSNEPTPTGSTDNARRVAEEQSLVFLKGNLLGN
jgi:hypothetical protein